MIRIFLVQTAPDTDPGSMAAYGRLVRDAVKASVMSDVSLDILPFYRPGGGSMWMNHLWRLRHGPSLFHEAKGDLFHVLDGSMAGLVPEAYQKRTLITVHDMIPALQKEGRLDGRPSLPAAWVINRGIITLQRSRGLCAVSTHTKEDVTRLTGRKDLVVIPHAVRPLPSASAISHRELPERFIFHVGNNAPYKNRSGVLEIFRRLQDDATLHLVMAGPPPGTQLRDAASGMKRVIFLDQVDDALLSRLYREARLLLFPSWYEGFGMPVLEAMSAGCPVVCSTGGALAETAGGAALTAAPGDYEQLALLCREIIRRPELRSQLIDKGRRHAAGFTGQRMGASLVEWYRNCVGQGNGV